MNIENAKIAIDKMSAFLPEYILNDLYKDHNSTANIISKDDSKVVFSVVFNDGEKRILTVTVKRNVGADDARLHRHEINVHYNGTMQVFSQLITAEFYSDIVNVLFPEDSSSDAQVEVVSEKTGADININSKPQSFFDGYDSKVAEIIGMGFEAARDKLNFDYPVGEKFKGSSEGYYFMQGEGQALLDNLKG